MATDVRMLLSLSETEETDPRLPGRAAASGSRYPMGICTVRQPVTILVIRSHLVAVRHHSTANVTDKFNRDAFPVGTLTQENCFRFTDAILKMAADDAFVLGDFWTTRKSRKITSITEKRLIPVLARSKRKLENRCDCATEKIWLP